MLYKESAIAVMVAVMLGAASLLGGLSTIPAFAIHDPDAVQIASKTISQASNSTTTIDAIEFTAKKSTLRSSGTITFEVIQDDEILGSTTLEASRLSTLVGTVEVGLANIDVQGNFEIRVFYLGSGTIGVSGIDVVDGVNTDSSGDNTGASSEGNDETTTAEEPPQEVENVVATKTIVQADDGTMTVDTVEFTAKKSTLRSSGTLTVAIVQNGEVLDTVQISTRALDTFNTDLEASFDDIELTDDFDVVIMYEGSGLVMVGGINVPGATTTAGNQPQAPPTTSPNPDGTAQLAVKAIDQNGVTASPGLFVAVLQGMTLVDDGLNDVTFTLDAGETYVVEMGDYYDADNAINYEFEEWVGSGHTGKRISVLLDSSKEITARYTITTNSSPPTSPSRGEPPSSPPAGGGSGTITVFANRIPDPNWGPTFTGANVQMYFVLYNSTGWIVHTGFFDENGHTITGLNDGETYWISPTDCDECHGDPHDVVFHHWEDNSTERQRAVTTGQTASAYYAYDPDP